LSRFSATSTAANHFPTAQFHEDVNGPEAVFACGDLGMPQKTRVNPGIAQCKRLAIDPERPILQRTHNVIGRVHQTIQIATVLPALAHGSGNKHFERRVARARSHSCETRIDPVATFLDCHQRIRDAQAQIAVPRD
jgi:hypothetical protein